MTWSTIVWLEWPRRELSPNFRSRKLMIIAKAKKRARGNAFLSTLACVDARILPPPVGRLDVNIEASPPDRRCRDGDNLVASLKAALDGIADGLGVDDSVFLVHPPRFTDPDKYGMGRILVIVSEAKQ